MALSNLDRSFTCSIFRFGKTSTPFLINSISTAPDFNRHIKEILLKKAREESPPFHRGPPSDLSKLQSCIKMNQNWRILVFARLHPVLDFGSMPRLSDSGDDARKWNTREKLAGREKGKREGICSRFIFVFALSQFSGPDYLGAWKRLWFCGKDSETVVVSRNVGYFSS